MSWSTRPAQKKLRISLDVRSGRTTRYSETEVPDGEVVTIALQAAIVEGGEESYHRGKRMDAKEAREALREEEERLEHHRPGSAPQQPRRVAVSDAELKAYAKAWKSGSIDFDGLAMAVGADMAMEILRTAESESDISSRDLVDKWGGDVMRIFQAWYVQGKTREDVEGAGVGSDTMRGLVTGSGPRTDEEVQVDSLEMMIPDVPADPSCELSARRRWQEMTMSTGHMEKPLSAALGPSSWAKTRSPDPAFVASLVSYHQDKLENAVARLSSGRPFADWVFNMDTSVLPSPVSRKWLDNSTKDSASSQATLRYALSTLARGLARLSSGPSLADAVFDAESAKLLEPVAPDDIQPRVSLQQIASLGPKQISVLMAHENEMLAAGVGRLSSGKAFADYIFGMDTGELPSELPSEAYLEHFAQDHGLSRFAVNATMSMIGRAVSQLSSGKPLADAVFGCDVSHLSIPNKVVMAGTQSPAARLSWHAILQQRGCFERRLGPLLQAMAVPTDMTGTKLAETFSATKPLGLRPEITPCMIFGHSTALAEAEGHLSKGTFDSAIPAAEAVRNDLQAKGDAVGSAHAVRVLLLAQLQKVIASEDDDAPAVTAESILTEAEKELDKSKSSGNSTAKAILQLAFTELLGVGTARTGWSPDRPMRDKALDSANQAVDLFKEAGDTKMSAVAKLEISSLLCQGAAAKTALQAAQEGFDIFERLGDKQGMGRATWLMARSKLVAKDFDGALSKGHEALDLIRASGDKRAEALFLECLVQWSLTEGKPHKALVMAKEAFALRLELEAPPKEEARSCLLLVEALAGVKKVRRGLKAAEECHDRLKKVGDRAQVYGLVVVAMAQLKRDHPELALTAIDEAIDIAREIGERRLEMMAQCTHAEVNVQLQSRPDALEAAEEAAAIAEDWWCRVELKDAKAEADCECMLVSILLRGVLDRASLVKALAAAKKAKELYKKARFRRGEAKALIHRASVLGMDTAVSSAEEMLQEEEDLLGRSAALQLVAEAQLVKEGFDEASQAAQDRRALWKGLGCRKEEGDAVLQLARILLASSEYDAAERHGMEAQKIFQEVGDKAAESVACVHLAQACLKKMSAEAEGETKEALASPSYRSSAEKAMRAANDAITACRHLGSKQLRAGALFWRAQVLGFRGRLEESLRVVLDAEKTILDMDRRERTTARREH
eukprot:s7335_g1.t2